MKLTVNLLLVAALPAFGGETVYSREDASREERFANPPASARILPLHHGRPNDKAKADAELATLKRQGFGGFAGNVNFDTNYLENAASWETLRYTLGKARAMGMTFWLYDEKGYPSCAAGGKTLEGHPEWAARAYLVAVTNVPAGCAALPPSPPGRPVATLRRKSADGKGETVYVVTDDYILEGTHVSVSVSHFKYRYPNLLMREPTARFIEITHDAYKRELGPDLLRYTTSTFTDEPSLMTMWMRPMPYLCLPVSDELLAAYAKAAGHPLFEDVPELVSGEPSGAVAAVRHRFWSMVGERVSKNYIGQLTDWATANGILSGGHLLSEESLVSHIPLYGDFFRTMRSFSAPGCDVLTSVPANVPWVTPALPGSAAELNGARRVMSEASDHSQKYRKKGDTRPVYQVSVREIVGSLNRQIWGGVNTFTSYYRWGPFSDVEIRAINEEIGRTVTLMSEGRTAADIALLYPSDALMTGFTPCTGGARGGGAQRISDTFRRTGRLLFTDGRPFMIVDADALAEAEVRDGALVRGPLAWRTVILPHVGTLPLAAARKLADLVKAGGLVIALGELPVNSERAFPDDALKSLTKGWASLDDTQSEFLVDFLEACHRPAIRVVRGKADVLRFAHRHTDRGDVFLAMNDSGADWSGAVRLPGDPAVRIWNPRVGLSTSARGEIPLDLPAYGAVVLTTDGRVEGSLVSGRAMTFCPHLVPISRAPAKANLGKGMHVKAVTTELPDGFTRVETELTKSDVDTFAFYRWHYGSSPFPSAAKGVGYTVRALNSNGGSVLSGMFITDRDGNQWYKACPVDLSKGGTHEVTAAFASFAPHGGKLKGAVPALTAADVVSVSFGYGGHYGKAGDKIAFEVSAPKSLEL